MLLEEPTAIVHDWFQGLHGSERVVDLIRSGFFGDGREPDIFTFAAARDVIPDELADRIVHESRLGSLPGIRQVGREAGRWRYLLPYMPHYFASLDLSEYDLVIASSHACAINARPREDALFVCYSHTPMRYAWLPETDTGPVDRFSALGLRLFRTYLRRTDLAASRRPDAFAANSTAVRDRIQRFYGRDATVIHPPVDVAELDETEEKDSGHFLWVHRLVPYKQPELVMEAFRDLPYRLTMVGVGPLESQLRKRLPPNVELLGWVSRPELAELYARAAGFVHIGEEDFGITMVEALAAGTPVIALDAGGARDIVRAETDGVLIERAGLGDLQAAVRTVAQRSWDPQALRSRALEFSADRFLEQMRTWLDEVSVEARGRPVRWAAPQCTGESAPVRIGVDARNDQAGIGRYTFSLIRELANIDRDNEYVLFLRRERFATYPAPSPNFRTVEAEIPWFTVREQLLLPRLVARERLDLMHYPHLTVPLGSRTPFVVTVHDLNYLDGSKIFAGGGSRVRRAGYRVELAKARRARRLIAVSEHTRDTVVRALRVDPARVAVTYEAADPPGAVEPDTSVLARHGLDSPFFLYVGAAYPYKNLARLIDAFAQLGGDHKLVLAGDQEDFGPALRERAAGAGLGERVVFPGRVSAAELAALYDAALAYVFVSLSEGFGLPGLEAMSAGLPVVAASAGSLPEIYGEAAKYCDPLDVEAIVEALAQVAEDEDLRSRLGDLGRRRAAQFSWAKTAEQTLDVYRNAITSAV